MTQNHACTDGQSSSYPTSGTDVHKSHWKVSIWRFLFSYTVFRYFVALWYFLFVLVFGRHSSFTGLSRSWIFLIQQCNKVQFSGGVSIDINFSSPLNLIKNLWIRHHLCMWPVHWIFVIFEPLYFVLWFLFVLLFVAL